MFWGCHLHTHSQRSRWNVCVHGIGDICTDVLGCWNSLLRICSPSGTHRSDVLSLFSQGKKEKADRNRRQETTAWGPDTSTAAFQGKGMMPEMMDWLNIFIIRHADHTSGSWEEPAPTYSSFHCRFLSLPANHVLPVLHPVSFSYTGHCYWNGLGSIEAEWYACVLLRNAVIYYTQC